MVVQVRYFASLAERTGCSSETVEIEDGADVTSLWEALVERHDGLADLAFRPLVACDLNYAGWNQVLDGVEEVAFLPPVSGG
jgi:molybdopterin converting factor subunit 1